MNWVSLSYKNIYRSKRRTILTMLSLSAVAFVMVFQHTIIRGMQKDLISNIKEFQTGDFYIENKDLNKYQMFNPMSLLIDPVPIERLLAQEKKIQVVENMNFPVSLYQNDSMYFASGIALSMNQFSQGKRSVFRIYEEKGHLPHGDGEVAVALNFAQKQHIQVGDRISILTQTVSHSLNGASFTVSAIIYFSSESYNGDTLLFDIPGGKKLLKTSQVMRVLVNTGGDDALAKKWMDILTPQMNQENDIVRGWQDSHAASILKVQNEIMYIVNVVFFIVGGTIIVNTSMMNILERRREIGMMASLGTSVGEIRFLFFLESIWLGVLGTILGILVGCILAAILHHTGWDLLGKAISQETGLAISSTIYPQIMLKDIGQIFFFGFIISAVISYFPTGKIAKISPAEAFRS